MANKMLVWLGDFNRGIGFFREADGSDSLQGRIVNVGTENGRGGLSLTEGQDRSEEYRQHVARLDGHPRLNDKNLAVRWDGQKYVKVYDGLDDSEAGKPL